MNGSPVWGEIRPKAVVSALFTTLALLWRYTLTRYTKPDMVLVGAMASVVWVRSGTERTGYISFADEPTNENDLDAFGISKQETFHWLAGIGELISLLWKPHAHGWTVRDATLIYASVIE